MSKAENGAHFEDVVGVLIDTADHARPEGDGGKAGQAPDAPSAGVDLAAWGRGEVDYPFKDVTRALEEFVISEIFQLADARLAGTESPRGAVNFLISNGLVDEAEARQDV